MSYYKVFQLSKIMNTSTELIAWCEREQAPNSLNVFLPSTSGVHGSYCSLDDIEKNWGEEDYTPELTVMLIKPRIVQVAYGTVRVTKEDIPKLREIMAQSLDCLSGYYEGNVKADG